MRRRALIGAQGSPELINVALAANGGVATASSKSGSVDDPRYSHMDAINGNRGGDQLLKWGTAGGGWSDGILSVYPDWLQVDFSAPKTISRIDVFTLQNNFSNPVEPTPALSCSSYGIIDFTFEYWNGSAWVVLEAVINNNLVWRFVEFAPVSTEKVRINISNSRAGYSRIVELEAWGY